MPNDVAWYRLKDVLAVLQLSKPLKEQYAKVRDGGWLSRDHHVPWLRTGARSGCGTAPGLLQLQRDVQEGHDSMGGGEARL